MPVCGRFRKSPQAGPCKTAQRSGCRHTHLTESRGEGGGERPFPRLPLISRPMSGIGALITGRPVSGCRGETAPFRVRSTFRFQGRATGPRPVSGCCGETAPFRVRGTFRFQGRATGPRPVSANVSSPSCPTAFFANPDPGPPPRSSFRLIRCLPEAQFPSVLGPAEGEGSGRPSVARRSLRGRILRFPPLSAGRFPQGFSSSRPTVRHMTYRNRAIVPPRCGLQRAGSVPPRSAERRAVRRPVPVVRPPTAPRPFMGSAPLAERIPPHRAAGCSDEEAFGDHRLFPAASPLFCRFALTKGRPLLTNGFGALIFAGSPFPVRRPLPEIKSTWGGRRRQHHGRFGRSN